MEELLAKVMQEEMEKLQCITVQKELELEFDLGNLLASESNPPPSDGAALGWALARVRAAGPGAGQHAASDQLAVAATN